MIVPAVRFCNFHRFSTSLSLSLCLNNSKFSGIPWLSWDHIGKRNCCGEPTLFCLYPSHCQAPALASLLLVAPLGSARLQMAAINNLCPRTRSSSVLRLAVFNKPSRIVPPHTHTHTAGSGSFIPHILLAGRGQVGTRPRP